MWNFLPQDVVLAPGLHAIQRGLGWFMEEKCIIGHKSYDCMQPQGFRCGVSLNAGCKEVATGYSYLVLWHPEATDGPLLESGIWTRWVLSLIQQGSTYVLTQSNTPPIWVAYPSTVPIAWISCKPDSLLENSGAAIQSYLTCLRNTLNKAMVATLSSQEYKYEKYMKIMMQLQLYEGKLIFMLRKHKCLNP